MNRYDFPVNTIEMKQTMDYYKAFEDILIDHESVLALKTKAQLEQVLVIHSDYKIKFERFINWLHDGGAKFSNVDFIFSNNKYPDLYSTKVFAVDEKIMVIPMQLMITLKHARNTQIGSFFKNIDLYSPNHSLLSSFILQEILNPNSFWKPYLDILPDTFDNFPIFYTAADEKLLEGSPFLKIIKEKRSALKEDYENICQTVNEFSRFSLEDYSKAMMIMSSRVFGCQIDGEKEMALVPLIDMLNHESPKQTYWNHDEEINCFTSCAEHRIEKHKKISYSCGLKCNSRFLLNYGIFVKENKENEYPIEVEIVANEVNSNFIALLISSQVEIKNKSVYKMQGNTKIAEFTELMSCLRFNNITTETELILLEGYIFEGISSYPKDILPISILNERKALNNLMKIAEENLKKYPTSITEDEELLGKFLTLNQKNCISMRLCEKKVLEYLIRLGQVVVPLLELPYSQIRKNTLILEFQEYIETSIKYLKSIA